MGHDKTVFEVASLLGVHHNSVRKWVTLLENRGYAIQRGQRGKLQVKLFSEEDINILRSIRDAAKQPNVTLEQAVASTIQATVAAQRMEPTAEPVEVTPSPVPDVTLSIEARLNIHEKQLEAQLAFNKELVDRLEQSQRFIEESIKRRDEQLTQVIRGLLEAASSRGKDEVEVRRRRRWWKFGKS